MTGRAHSCSQLLQEPALQLSCRSLLLSANQSERLVVGWSQ
uniref:Uncharacterized protein n=1 Tax=Rhizophora mucronata TaxID=61149 RepID=A0A2P2QCM9_RHIMU